jgi:hypothetical protein
MTSDDLLNMADTMEMRARLDQPLSIAELRATAAVLRVLGKQVASMESHPIPPSKRWPVIDGGAA